MAQVIRITQPGGPQVLRLDEVTAGTPGAGEALVRQSAVGVNFIDVYHRTGLYALPAYPAGIGLEAAGIVEEVGAGVSHVRPGDRVAYSGGPTGAYATQRVLPAKFLVKLPDGLSFEDAACVMLKGLTAHYLLRRTFPVKKGDVILFHAAAGGVGLLACQWAHHLGARVIGTAGDEKKAALARANGCDEVILYRQENVPARLRELTGGQGADVVYDSVGASTFMDSLDCLKRFGMLVSFGQSSGSIPPFDPGLLTQKGSLYLTRPTLMHHIEDPAAYQSAAQELFALMAGGIIKVHRGGNYPLAQAAQAHMDLEARKTTGALLLIP